MTGSFFMATFVAIFPIFSLFPSFSQKTLEKIKKFPKSFDDFSNGAICVLKRHKRIHGSAFSCGDSSLHRPPNFKCISMTALSSCYGAVQEGFTELCQHWTQSGCSSGSSSEDSFRIRKKGEKNEQRSINFGRIEKHARTARVVPGPQLLRHHQV